MEGTEDIYVNDKLAPKKKVKKKEVPAGAQRFREKDDPDYENISMTVRNQNGALEQQSMPVHWAPAASAPRSSSGLCLVRRSSLCLSLLLVLSFLLSISLLSLVVVKSSDFSEKLMSMKSELWNVSSILQKEQENAEQLETKIIKIKAINDACDAKTCQARASS
ncbi:uncharacterized protein LOC114029646 isoform X2 [Vombatus ursinus]|uniref:uncharacterized protein LOC114029646 isoform X2 n=1 Tax=Vombatus ursinus TaxID=29139 RepID=UPI000FFCEC24|nr:uncharacterized protein LOC114029646 isoform X2 [Vombatus ursinus]